jgi:hypothetical protein
MLLLDRCPYMNAYAPVQSTCPAPLTSADITRLFQKSQGWFDRDRVRKRLYATGFPHPFERGLWSAQAVAAWLADVGRNPGQMPPAAAGRRQRISRGRGNAYARAH